MLRKKRQLVQILEPAGKRGTHELIQNLATSTGNMKVSVCARFNLKTYRPSRGTSADPFASTDAIILAGAPCLAFPGTRLLTAGGEMESTLNNSLMDHFRQKHSMCPGTFLKTYVNVLFYSKSAQKKCLFFLISNISTSSGVKYVYSRIALFFFRISRYLNLTYFTFLLL